MSFSSVARPSQAHGDPSKPPEEAERISEHIDPLARAHVTTSLAKPLCPAQGPSPAAANCCCCCFSEILHQTRLERPGAVHPPSPRP
ncbi:hypothetical protein VTO42DRAFT_1889 [Malbranchea cinnamomea]